MLPAHGRTWPRLERADGSINVFEAVVAHVGALQASRKKVVIALWVKAPCDHQERLNEGPQAPAVSLRVNSWRTVQATPRNEAMLAVVGMESGFETDQVAVISEQDILGDNWGTAKRKAGRNSINFSGSKPSPAGDLVVHVEHGIGRFIGLQTLDVAGAPHDCMVLMCKRNTICSGVEMSELLSRCSSGTEMSSPMKRRGV